MKSLRTDEKFTLLSCKLKKRDKLESLDDTSLPRKRRMPACNGTIYLDRIGVPFVGGNVFQTDIF